MKGGAVFGVLAGLAGVGLLVALASKDGPATKLSSGLRPPIEAGKRYMVTYTMPAGMTQPEALALLGFVAQWGALIAAPQFAPDRAGRPTAVVSALALVPLADGPPEIPSPRGALVPLAWAELPPQQGGQS